jgi:hypothetical protein
MWNDQVLNQSSPRLYSFAKQENATVKSIISVADFHDNLFLPLSEEAYEEFCELSVYLQYMEISEEKDKWSYIWGSVEYSCRKASKHLSGSSEVHSAFGWIWRSAGQMKHKVFYWLLLQNRLNTRSMLRRRHMILDSYVCEQCLRQVDELNMHLFFRCSFTKNYWYQIGVTVPTWLRPDRATKHIKRSLDVPFAMEIIMLMTWRIWKERNAWLFSNLDHSVEHCKAVFKEFDLVIHRAKERWVNDMESWLINLG